jgi:hypothetical protein
MRSAVGWVLPAIAVVATAVAVAAGPNDSLALGAAAVAILAAGLVFVGGISDQTGVPSALPSLRPSPETDRLRAAIRSGPLGREYVLDTLDRVERAGPNPDLPFRTVPVTDALVALPYDQFLRYLRGRVEALEEET